MELLLRLSALFSIAGSSWGQSGGALQCYKCNERLLGFNVCLTKGVEDCGRVFPQQDSVCIKIVQRLTSQLGLFLFMPL